MRDTLWDCFQDYSAYSGRHRILACALALVWLVLLAQWRGGRARRQVLAGVLALCGLNGPLLVVSPVESRNLFPSYVILTLIAAVLWQEARRQGFPALRHIWMPGLLVCVLMIGVYGANFRVYHQRLVYAQVQAAQGAEEVTLPLVPFRGWTANEQVSKGDICYLVYREEPWDVSFRFVPYQEFPS